jgi:hypothetical protein
VFVIVVAIVIARQEKENRDTPPCERKPFDQRCPYCTRHFDDADLYHAHLKHFCIGLRRQA